MKITLLLIVSLIPISLRAQKDTFIPDTSVLGIKLLDYNSLKSKIPNVLNLIDYNGPGAQVHLLNKDETEILDLIFYTSSDVVDAIRISVNDKSLSHLVKTSKLNIDRFITESKINLYLTKKELISKKGKNFKIETSDGKEIIRYSIKDFNSSNFLQRHNYPFGYFANYTFINGQLIELYFGFVNP